jgi:hypothetical protein
MRQPNRAANKKLSADEWLRLDVPMSDCILQSAKRRALQITRPFSVVGSKAK